jgi:peptide/nickel transport system permease protein
MWNYILRRVLYMVPVLLGIALIVFVLFNMVGGDPALNMAGKHATPERVAEIRAELGLDRPKVVQFVGFLRQVVTLDYGRSYTSKQDIVSMIKAAAPVSLVLALPAFLISNLLSISLALFVAFWRGTWIDKSIVVVSVFMISIPALAYILAGQYFLAYQWGLFPISGFSWGPELVSYIALPVIIWVALSLGGELRLYRTVMLDEVNQDYIRTARSKGLGERVVMFKHVLKNALIPIITSLVIQLPFLLTGSLLLESFFGIPGMGYMLIDAINSSDFPVVKAIVMIFSILYMMFNLINDICYSLADPRIVLK